MSKRWTVTIWSGCTQFLSEAIFALSFEVIWLEMFEEFVSRLTSEDLRKMVERVHKIVNDSSNDTSFGAWCLVVKDFSKTLTLNQLKRKWSDETKNLLGMYENKQMRRALKNRLNLKEEEIKWEQSGFRPWELFSKDEEMHYKLSRRRYWQRLTNTQKKYLSNLLLKNPDHSDYIKQTYKLSD